MNWKMLAAVFLLAFAACSSQEFFIPEGSPMAGKVVFSEHRCYACHEVKGEDFPAPSAIPSTFVSFGPGEFKSREYLMESVIAPSHRFALPRPPRGQTAGEENIKSGNKSRMANYSDTLTVREMLDLVAYLESVQNQEGSL
jgi:hypothetical protein